MAKEMLTIHCKLPHGLVLSVANSTITLNGKNRAEVVGMDHGSTQVPKDFWDAWVAEHAKFPAVTSKAVYAAKNDVDARAMGLEFQDIPTGFEGMKKKSHGVKPAKDDK